MIREFSTYYSSAYRTDGSFFDWQTKPTHKAGGEPSCFPYNLISFLALIADMEIDIYQVTWDGNSSTLGTGGTAVISQTAMEGDEGIAFKRVGANGQDYDIASDYLSMEARVFKALISEVSILTHPAIRTHPGIVDLEAICFETDFSYSIPKIMPVLIFLKAPFGDLDAFIESQKSITFEDAMRLLKDILQTVAYLHSHHLIHGDLKPKNILVFKDESGQPLAKLADFGYSLQETEVAIKLPISSGWHAPEVTDLHPEMTLQQAQKADIFALGLIALWLLQHIECSSDDTDVLMQDSETATSRDTDITQRKLYWFRIYEQVLRHGPQTHVIISLLGRFAAHTTENQAHQLKRFFNLALELSSEARISDCSELMTILGMDLPENVVEDVHSPEKSLCGTFRIAPLMSLIADLDYRIRRRVNELLFRLVHDKNACPKCSRNAALQYAACVTMGFGTTRNEDECSNLVAYSDRNTAALEAILQEIRNTGDGIDVNNHKILQLVMGGHLVSVPASGNLRHIGDLDASIEILEEELDSVTRFLGHTHTISFQLCVALSDIYERRWEWDKWATLCEGMIAQFDKEITENQSQGAEGDSENLRTRRAELLLYLGKSYKSLNRLAEALNATKFALSELDTLVDSDVNLTKRATKTNLATIYAELGEHDSAIELLQKMIDADTSQTDAYTIQLLQILSDVLVDRRDFSKAKEKLLLASQLAVKNPASSNLDLIKLKDRLGTMHWHLQEYNESLVLLEEVKNFWGMYGEKLGQVAPEYLMALSDLVDTLEFMDRPEEALPLALECKRLSENVSINLHDVALNSVVSVRCEMGQLDGLDAMALERLEVSMRQNGPNHPATLARQKQYSFVLAEQGRHDEAVKILRQTVQMYEDTGLTHKKRRAYYLTLWDLADTLREQEEWEEAAKYFSMTVDMSRQIYGEDHPEYWDNRDDLAGARSRGEGWQDRLPLRLRAAELAKQRFGVDSVQTVDALVDVAQANFRLFNFKAGETLYKTIIPLQIKIGGQGTAKTLRLRGNQAFGIGMVGFKKGDIRKMRKSLQLSEEIYEVTTKLLGLKHEDSRKCCENLMWAYTMLGRKKDASRMRKILESFDKSSNEQDAHSDADSDEWKTDPDEDL